MVRQAVTGKEMATGERFVNSWGFSLFVLMCMCLLVWMCGTCMQYPQRPEGSTGCSRTEVPGGCEVSDVGAQNQTQVSTRALAASTLHC